MAKDRRPSKIIRQLLFALSITIAYVNVSAKNIFDVTEPVPEIFNYHGMGNLLSNGFMTYDDGKCNYISLNTLTTNPDTTHCSPFRVLLPETPKAYWLEKDVMNCVLGDSTFIRVESRELRPDEQIGVNNLSGEDAWIMLGGFNINYNKYLEGLDPEAYSWFFKVVYDYFNAVNNISLSMFEKEESNNYLNVNFTIILQEAKFYFINVPAKRIIDCMRIAGSFERILRQSKS